MTKQKVIRKIREKLIKLTFYNDLAIKTWGKHIAADMFHEDLDYLSSILFLLEEKGEDV